MDRPSDIDDALRRAEAMLNNSDSVEALSLVNEVLAGARERIGTSEPESSAGASYADPSLTIAGPIDNAGTASDRDAILGRAWRIRGSALDALGETNEALDAYHHAVRLAPDDAENWNRRGSIRLALGEPTEALVDLSLIHI